MSCDPVAKHDKFVAKHKLPFALISVEDQKVCKAYGVWGRKKFMGREYMGMMRHTFVVDPKGNLELIYLKVKAATMADQILKDLGLD